MIRIAAAQVDPVVGDIRANLNRAKELLDWARTEEADLLVLPELFLTGYPPEDLVFHSAFVAENEAALAELASLTTHGPSVLVGFVHALSTPRPGQDALPRSLANAAGFLQDGEVAEVYEKVLLPNYGVFDEARYFAPGTRKGVTLPVAGHRVGVLICEDLWRDDLPATFSGRQGSWGQDDTSPQADVLVTLNASPYHRGKPLERLTLVRHAAELAQMPVVYVNCVGGQDEVVFDGGSLAVDKRGHLLAQAGICEESLFVLDVPTRLTPSSAQVSQKTTPARPPLKALPSLEEEVYAVLVAGLRSYVEKNSFPAVVLGLSGGIDSALVATLAADAIGAERVWGVGLPGPFSSEGSLTDAEDLASRLACRFDVVPIKGVYDAETTLLRDETGLFEGTPFGVTEENLQARIRGNLLMALSNKFGHLLLTTGNKSETSVGFCTLYGDTSGGFAPIKDVKKTLVFALSTWRNSLLPVDLARLGLLGPTSPIPTSTIEKPPSAELAPDQRDDMSLPPYEVLDPILELYVERSLSASDIVGQGFDPAVVSRVVRLVDNAEYKRRQVALGVKVTPRAFGRDRRLPITNHWRQS